MSLKEVRRLDQRTNASSELVNVPVKTPGGGACQHDYFRFAERNHSAEIIPQPVLNIKPKEGDATDCKQWHCKRDSHHAEQGAEQDDGYQGLCRG